MSGILGTNWSETSIRGKQLIHNTMKNKSYIGIIYTNKGNYSTFIMQDRFSCKLQLNNLEKSLKKIKEIKILNYPIIEICKPEPEINDYRFSNFF